QNIRHSFSLAGLLENSLVPIVAPRQTRSAHFLLLEKAALALNAVRPAGRRPRQRSRDACGALVICAITFWEGTMLKFPRRKFLHLVAGTAALPVVSRVATAQTYPARPVRIIVGYAPGGAGGSM